MLRSTARIATSRAERYRDQLARHGAGMLRHAHGEGGAGVPPIQDAVTVDGTVILVLAWGRCTVTASEDELLLIAEAANADDLARIQAGVGSRVARISRRDGLAVTWTTAEGEASHPAARRAARPSAGVVGAVSAVAILGAVVVIHLGLGAALLRGHWPWWALAGIAALVVLKLFVARHFAATVRGHRQMRRTR